MTRRKLRALPIDFDAPPTTSNGSDGTQVRSWPLWVLGLIGVASVAASLYLDIVAEVDNIVPSVFLELGAGVFLFAFLFWAERRVVRREVTRQTQALIEALTGSDDQAHEFAQDPNVGDPSRFAPDGPIDISFRFVEAMAKGRYEDAWELADADWRLCRAQAWLWNNRNHFGHDLSELDVLARQIATGPHKTRLWRDFVSVERAQYKGAWRGLTADRLGVATHQRRIARDYEVVILMPLGEYKKSGFVVRAPTLLADATVLVIHSTEDGHKVASHVAEAPPRPGWPPSWWIKNDPALEAEDRPPT